MSVWLIAGIALGAGVLCCALGCLHGGAVGAVVALEVAGVTAALALVVLSEQFGRQGFADLGLVLAVSSFVGALAFLRYVERG